MYEEERNYIRIIILYNEYEQSYFMQKFKFIWICPLKLCLQSIMKIFGDVELK